MPGLAPILSPYTLQRRRAGSPFDPDAQAFFTAAGITNPTQQSAVNTFVLGLKAASLWSKLSALYPFVGGTASAHSFNLKDPAQFQITWAGTVTHNANGITGDGSTGFGNTGISIPTLSQYDFQFGCYSRAFPSSDGGLFASSYAASGDSNRFYIDRSFGLFGAGIGASFSNIADNPITGLISVGVRNNGASGYHLSQNGSDLETKTGAVDGRQTGTLLFLKHGTAFTNSNLALGYVSVAMSQAEEATLYGLVQAYETSLSRQVSPPAPITEVFSWDTSSAIPAVGTAPPVSQLAVQYFYAALLEANPNDGGRQWLHIPTGSFNAGYWFCNDTSANVWGATLGKGQIDLSWMYTTTFAANALIQQFNCKNQIPPNYGTNDGIALRTKSVSGAPGIGGFSDSSCDVAWPTTPALATKHRLIQRWNRMTSNPTNTRTMIVYALQNTGERASAYSLATSLAPGQDYWSHFLPGNDTVTSLEQWLTDMYIQVGWDYDLPINLWQDFDFVTVDQASLESRDHNATAAWLLAGTTTRFTTSTSAQKTNPSTINLWTDTSTRGLRNDLSATAAGSIGTSFTATAASVNWSHWVRIPSLTVGTSAQISFATDGSNTVCALMARNNGGQHQIYLRNDAGTLSGFIDVSPDTWLWPSITATRNSTSRLQAFNETGVQIGSEVTVTASNNSISSVRIGSLQTTTAQSAGKYIDIAHFVHERPTKAYPIKPWE